MSLKFVCLLVFVCCIDISVDGLKKNDPGVCVVPKSVQKSRNGRVFNIKYKCGNKICTARRYKRVTYRETQNQMICCAGWKYDDDLHYCTAVCSKGCTGGNCVSPETCQCSPPSILDQENKNACHLPICKPTCENGQCIANNKCRCFEGFESVNGTCKPKCGSCENGKCVAPNVCECFEGYSKSEGSCKAMCKGCDDGVCVSSVCRCKDGYLRDIEREICYKPCNGTCGAGVCGYGQNVTMCCAGYNWASNKTSEICKPICKRSCGRHGVCIKPDECKCNPPYIVIEGTCGLPPTCDFPCHNGKCTDNNTCTCNSGYTSINETACEPECKQPCINGVCADPDKCVCLHGFKRKNQWECVPECDECENGECIATNVCNCSTGYVKEGNKCVPHCNSDCNHGRCSKPNECSCDSGYEVDPLKKLTCHPICETRCINATCTEPNQCSCLPGYTRSANTSVCKPECDYCTNGECVAPNKCRCHNGYKMSGIKCVPVCTKQCVHGFCSEPDKCTCTGGYVPDESNKYLCRPHCSQCVNAKCIAPDTCECIEDFERKNGSTICTPKCERCVNGQCTSPGVCACNDGYVKSNGTCRPVCSPACVNGYCQAPNECACFEGYKMNSTDYSICYKPCICNNGVCSSNGTCTCNSGFELNGDTCESNETFSVDCQSCHGNCAESECSCSDGRPCNDNLDQKALKTGLAGLELTWILGACVASLLIVLVLAIMVQMWRRRQDYIKAANTESNTKGSVVFTAPGTLRNRVLDNKVEEYDDIDEEVDDDNKLTEETLLPDDIRFEHERL